MTTRAREVEAWLRAEALYERTCGSEPFHLERAEKIDGYTSALSALIAECEHSRERTRTILKLHYLTGIHCNHEHMTDRASCWCSQWRGREQPSVGAAVDEWIEHVMSEHDKLFAPPPQPVPVGEEKGETK